MIITRSQQGQLFKTYMETTLLQLSLGAMATVISAEKRQLLVTYGNNFSWFLDVEKAPKIQGCSFGLCEE